jgi:hypothetical protein
VTGESSWYVWGESSRGPGALGRSGGHRMPEVRDVQGEQAMETQLQMGARTAVSASPVKR